ncbi:MAG TPA: BON domain-containing protein [Verrucomicrobiae bacterium]|nr:BON domain-containing protein [Verrucomicrobiae bacterium]
MKGYLTATAAVLAFSAHAQLSGPNRIGPGTSPGTFQTPGSTASSIQVTTPDSAAISVAPPVANPRTGPLPRTSLGTPDATAGTLGDSLRSRSAFPSSRDWETGVGAPAGSEIGTDSRRLTPPSSTVNPNISRTLPTSPTPPAVTRPVPPAVTSPVAPAVTSPVPPSTTTVAPSTTTVTPSTTTPGIGSDLNTTGVNTPPRAAEQPLDKALSAKIRADLSQTPARATMRLSPETIRDMRITSQGGKVILEGNVGSAVEKQMIEVQARRVPGVVAVENRLSVRSRDVGAPATSQIGQSPRNTTDLNDDHPALRPANE